MPGAKHLDDSGVSHLAPALFRRCSLNSEQKRCVVSVFKQIHTLFSIDQSTVKRVLELEETLEASRASRARFAREELDRGPRAGMTRFRPQKTRDQAQRGP